MAIQRLVVVRPVQVHQVLAEAFEQSESDRRIIDELAVCAHADHPADDELGVVAGRKSAVFEHGLDFPGVARSSKTASTEQESSPVRINDFSARSPSTSLRAPTMTDFPAPVSPVTLIKPGPSSHESSSTKAKLRILRSVSIWGTPGIMQGTAPESTAA